MELNNKNQSISNLDLDRLITHLFECKPPTEVEVKFLCEKANF